MERIRWGVVAVWYGVAVAGISACGALVWLAADAGQLVQTALTALAMVSPLLATVLTERWAPHPETLSWRPRLSRWIAVASALGLAIPLLALLATPLWPGAGWDPSMQAMFERFGGALTEAQLAEMRAQIEALPVHPMILALPQAVIAGLTINALFAFGEEIGWRGWLQRELAPLGFWPASLVTGLLWGLWHAPLILQGHNYPSHPVVGVPLFTVVCIALSPIHAHVRQRGGTVWAAAVLHGTFNAAAGLSMMVATGPDLWIGVQGGAGLVALVAVNLGLLALRRS